VSTPFLTKNKFFGAAPPSGKISTVHWCPFLFFKARVGKNPVFLRKHPLLLEKK
jgi:hypothetical protein